MELVLGDITPIKMGAGSIWYRRDDRMQFLEITSATIFGLVVVAYFNDLGKERRVAFPLANLVEHTSEVKS